MEKRKHIELNDDSEDHDEEPKNKKLREELQIVARENKEVRKPILNEEILEDHCVIDDVINVANGDCRSINNIKDGAKIQIKWYFEDESGYWEWCDATIEKSDTGEIHTFVDDDNGDEEEPETSDCPIVLVKYTQNNELCKVCFLTNHLVYNIKEDNIILWRHLGDEFDEPEDDEDMDSTDTDMKLIFRNEQETEILSEHLIKYYFMNVLKSHKDKYEKLPVIYQNDIARLTLKVKDLLVKHMSEFYKTEMRKGNSYVTLTENAIDDIFGNAFNELEQLEEEEEEMLYKNIITY